MKLAALILLVFVLACGSGAEWQTHGVTPQPSASSMTSKKMVQGKIECLKWADRDCSPFSRVTDDQTQIGVHLLVATDGMACEVTGQEITMVLPESEYECVWRFYRP